MPAPRSPAPAEVLVVGGGIAGLAAAYALRMATPGLAVTVLEAESRIGGKLRVGQIAGVPVDEGAEALLTRRPEAVELARQVGLDDQLVAATTSKAGIWTRGRIRALPPTVLGIPTHLAALIRSGVLSTRGTARVPLERALPGMRCDGDVALGGLAAARLGWEVRDRLVEPLLGGVYAGHAAALSLRATAPALAAQLAQRRRLLSAAAAVARASPATGQPAFVGIVGGVGRLAGAVADASGAAVRTGVPVRELHRLPGGRWRVVTGPVPAPQAREVDAVVLALPAASAGRLLRSVAPRAAAELAGIEYASVGILTLAFSAAALRAPLIGSGFLVPPVDARLVKACTYSSTKWGWLGSAAGDTVILRCSVGRHREVRDLQREDAELVDLVIRDLGNAIGLQGRPVDASVTRWGGALPQYAVGHLERVRRIRTELAEFPGLVVCGAAYDGIGVPACIGSAELAATSLVASLRASGKMGV